MCTKSDGDGIACAHTARTLRVPGATPTTLPVESHPFTIASIPGENLKEEQELTFVIRGREGLTQKVLARAAKKDSIKVPVFVDGPYSAPPNFALYTTCILVAGGTGVSYTLPLLLDLIRRGTAITQKTVFVWVVRNGKYVDWISGPLATALSSAPASLAIDVKLYVTGADSTKASTSPEPDAEAKSGNSRSQESAEFGGIAAVQGRPDVRLLLAAEIRDAAVPVSVNVSGPASLNKAVRASLAHLGATVDVLRGGA